MSTLPVDVLSVLSALEGRASCLLDAEFARNAASAVRDLIGALKQSEKALNDIRCCCPHTAWEQTGPAVASARAALARCKGESA